ncbi:hypothetical protein DPEC_G00172730 [Dallia pectoralis]|uniref:Uncharacterized protein n=1 Tax=Dallia pectoralis TaxID=75939 RepID=A0ACC2GDZ5_DALPE|nr:hypothetical protein DPEC_G00172730 [Dallia pectoralis]
MNATDMDGNYFEMPTNPLTSPLTLVLRLHLPGQRGEFSSFLLVGTVPGRTRYLTHGTFRADFRFTALRARKTLPEKKTCASRGRCD